MRPKSIQWFERLFLAGLAFGAINAALTYDDAVAVMQANPALADAGVAGPFVLAVSALSIIVALLLWYLIARRRSAIAKWILVILTGLGLYFVRYDTANLLSLTNVLTFAALALQIAGLFYLFQDDARHWLAGDDEVPDGAAQ